MPRKQKFVTAVNEFEYKGWKVRVEGRKPRRQAVSFNEIFSAYCTKDSKAQRLGPYLNLDLASGAARACIDAGTWD
jgi:hypothetical protein